MRKMLSTYWLIIVIFAFAIIILPWKSAFNREAFVTIQFIAIGIISGIGILNENRYRPYSLVMVHWFFIFSFMFCAGITQFANASYRWGLTATNEMVEKGNWIIILWELIFILVSLPNVRFKLFGTYSRPFSENQHSLRSGVLIIAILVLDLIGGITLTRGGVMALLNRTVYGSSNIVSMIPNSSFRLLVNAILTGFCLWATISALSYYQEKKTVKGILVIICAFLALLLNVPPTGVPRYEAAAVYGGIIISRWKYLKRSNIFFYLLAFGLLVIFPLLNSFRGTMYSLVSYEAINNSLGSIQTNFLRADYDAYSMLLYTVKYVEQIGSTYGLQLLGVLLFFIPRTIWHSKPGGSGALIIDNLASDYNSNVSCPMPAEGYINFGIIGVVLFAAVFSYILHSQDKKYWSANENAQDNSMLYACALPFVLFILRGDLMSTFAFFFGFSVSLWLYRKIMYI